MEITEMKLSDLKPTNYNPRKELREGDPEYEKIKKSILAFGMVEPIVWNFRTGNIVGGLQRYTVLRDLGYETVLVSIIDVDEVQEKTLNIALNKIKGQWDNEKLADLLEELTNTADETFAQFTGFSSAEINNIMDEHHNAEQDDEPNGDTPFNYQEQLGVIIICQSSGEQQRVFEAMTERRLKCKVVTT